MQPFTSPWPGEVPPDTTAAAGPTLLAALPIGAYTCDADGRITWFNQRAADLWGRVPRLNDEVDRFCGSFKLFDCDGLPVSHDQCWTALALEGNRGYHGVYITVERPDGGRRTALTFAHPLRDGNGRLTGAIVLLADRQRSRAPRRSPDHRNAPGSDRRNPHGADRRRSDLRTP